MSVSGLNLGYWSHLCTIHFYPIFDKLANSFDTSKTLNSTFKGAIDTSMSLSARSLPKNASFSGSRRHKLVLVDGYRVIGHIELYFSFKATAPPVVISNYHHNYH